MTLVDKYKLIENHLINDNPKTIVNKIENYIENYLSSDLKVLVPEYINQGLWLNNINTPELINSIQCYIKNYLIQRRNNIRIFIKKDNFELTDLTKFLKEFMLKIKYIKDLLRSDHTLLKNSYSILNNLIISDSIILIFIEEQVISFNKNIKEFLLFIKKLDLLYWDTMYDKTLKLFGNFYKKKIINSEELPIPNNYRLMQKLNNTIIYYYTINNFYKFIKENIIELNLPIFKLILEDLIKIIKFNSLPEIEYTLSNMWFYIINIKKYNFEEKESLMATISDEIINRCILNNNNNNDNINDVISIIKFGKYASELIKTTYYNKYNIFIAKISESLNYFFRDDKDELERNKFINSLINESIINNNINVAVTCITDIKNINNIDSFINIYYELLITRLTNNFCLKNNDEFLNYINSERILITTIIKSKNDINNLTYKLNKIINDTELSYTENKQFNLLSTKLLNTDLCVLTTSYNNWNINTCEGIIDNKILDIIKETQLGKYLKYYEMYYFEKYNSKRIINFVPNFGEVTIIYLNQELKMFPIQFMIIELFNKTDKIPLKDIINSKILYNYPEKFKTDLVNSIIISELFIIQNDNIIISNSNNIKNNLIDIFINTSEYPNIWEKQKEVELSYSRVEIVNSVINHTVKITPKNKNELFELVKDKIQVFKLTDELFDKSIEYLIDMDYIILNKENEYEKLF